MHVFYIENRSLNYGIACTIFIELNNFYFYSVYLNKFFTNQIAYKPV